VLNTYILDHPHVQCFSITLGILERFVHVKSAVAYDYGKPIATARSLTTQGNPSALK
jgi:hypothetical protein